MKFFAFVASLLASVSFALGQGQQPTTGSGGPATGTNTWLPPDTAFTKVVLDEDATIDGKKQDTIDNPMELTVAPDGRVFWIEIAGPVKMWKPDTKQTVEIGKIPVFCDRPHGYEDGLLGITLDPKFAKNGWIYLNHSLPDTSTNSKGEKSGIIRVSRYTLTGEKLDMASELKIIDIPEQRITCCHVGGSLTFDKQGNLYVSVGDNSNPFDSEGFDPIDERPGHEPWDSQRSAANANALTGKILRVKPRAEGGYDIPKGNLFKPGTEGTRPEVYVMGNRNPFRISVDPRTGYLYWGEVGPDAGGPDPFRGPAGFDEVNQAREAGFFGWPYFVADNKAYIKVDFNERAVHQDLEKAYEAAKKKLDELVKKGETNDLPALPPKPPKWEPHGVAFDAQHPVNNSPNNTGIKNLPPAQPAFIYYPGGASTKFPVVGTGGRTAMAGPVYYFDPKNTSPTKLPREFDHTLFIYEWSRNWIIAVKLDDHDRIAKMQRFLPSFEFKRPMDMELGPDGCLYVIEYGKEWGGNLDTKIDRLEYHGFTAN
jgi:cytochrome c